MTHRNCWCRVFHSDHPESEADVGPTITHSREVSGGPGLHADWLNQNRDRSVENRQVRRERQKCQNHHRSLFQVGLVRFVTLIIRRLCAVTPSDTE